MSAPASSLTVPTPLASAVRSRPPRGLVWLGLAASVLLAVALIRLIVFLQAPDPLRASGWSAAPWNAFLTRHACATAYWVASTDVEARRNIYDHTTYTTGRLDPVTRRPIPVFIGPFAVDPYEYPPTFLLVPRRLVPLTGHFPAFRQLWIALNALVVLIALVIVARRVDRATGGHSLWVTPLVLLPPGILVTLQAGNAQLAVFGLAMLAMLAFERRWPAAGGVLLAYAIVAKMFPGLLLIYLAVRREWRAVGWTAAWCVVLALLAIADLGWAPFDAFLDHLPKLLSGEAFPMLRIRDAPNVSLSAPGLVLKLPGLGGPDVPFGALRIAGWIYTVAIALAIVHLARRPLPQPLAPIAWLVVLGLGSLRSPFLPFFGGFAGIWIAVLLLGVFWSQPRVRWLALAAWLLLLPVFGGPSTTPPFVIAGTTTLQIAGLFALFAMAIRAARTRAAASEVAA